MKSVVLLLVLSVLLLGSFALGTSDAAHPQISTLEIDPHSVTVLRLQPGYASSIRLPEEVSSVVVGNPARFKAEHSEAEPRLVFIKPITSLPAQSNALITTKSGQEISLQLISPGKSPRDQAVDFLLEYQRPGSVLVDTSSASSFLIPESAASGNSAQQPATGPVKSVDLIGETLAMQSHVASPEWQGKGMRIALGEIRSERDLMIVPFSVLNDSEKWIEVLPPQIELSSTANNGKPIKAEPVAVSEYRLSGRQLSPGARVDGVAVFARPAFKESSERLMLQLSEAGQVNHPMLVPLPFVAPPEGGKQQ